MGSVDWSERGEYMSRRHGVSLTMASEALADQDRVVFDPDPKSATGRSVRTIGYSPTAGALITVITVQHQGTVYGANGWRSNSADQRQYREESQ